MREAAGFCSELRHAPKDVNFGRFALLRLALDIGELGNRLAGSESVYNGLDLNDSFLLLH